MITLKCIVIDDEPLAARLIGSYIERTPFMELVGVFGSAQEAIKTLLEERIDVAFLDIQMPQLTGLEMAKIVPEGCEIVFTTAYEKHAVESYKANALDYLLKPVSYDDFLRAANKALRQVELKHRLRTFDSDAEAIIVKSDYKLVQIPLTKILYIEGLKDYVKIFVENEQKCVMTLVSMKHLEKNLPNTMFMRIHRSYIVNLAKINRIERLHVVIGDATLPISESYRPSIAEYVNTHAIMPVKTFLNDLKDF